MKKLLLLYSMFLLLFENALPQIITEQTNEPIFFNVKSHNTSIKELPAKSFYKSKSDWQYIIDTTWGSGLPLAQKQQIFNTYVTKLEEKFDGFLSLGFTEESWDSLKAFYYDKIDSTTSRGRFSAIMYYFSMNLHDGHTYAYDKGVVETPLNPGIPVLVFGHKFSIKHFGAVTTVLEDSTALVLRVVENHPLNLEPGDIILGYEGVLWKDLVQELIDAEIPAFGGRTDLITGVGGTSGSQSALNSAIHISVGMNWHLFNTMDIYKHSTGDTLHLSVAPLLNLNIPDMLNNEQLEIPGIPFPDYWNQQLVTYGILPNSNVGYIYVFSENPEAVGDQQFFEAISDLQNTDGLIIDMRWNEGGGSLWYDAFKILCNDVIYTVDDAFRCSPLDWTLCPANTPSVCRLPGEAPKQYERPIAVLLGPACFSMGDLNAYRLKYLEAVRTFGKPIAANLGWNERITNYTDWLLRYSYTDMFHLNEPGSYLNRQEFPIDFPVWHNIDDVAAGTDAVVESAIYWVENLAYGHDVITDTGYYHPGIDTVNISAVIENPNSHQLSVRAYIETTEGVLADSLDLTPIAPGGNQWFTKLNPLTSEGCFKVTVSAIDHTDSTSFTTTNAARFSTAGPVVIEDLSIEYYPTSRTYKIIPSVKNAGQSFTIENLTIQMLTEDTLVTAINGLVNISSLPPGETIIPSGYFAFQVDTNFSGFISFNFKIMSDGWPYWYDSKQIPVDIREESLQPLTFNLEQNFPNPFNPSTTIEYNLPVKSQVKLVIYNSLGEQVKQLINEEKEAGKYSIEFNARTLPSGIYFYRIQAGDFQKTQKMVLMK